MLISLRVIIHWEKANKEERENMISLSLIKGVEEKNSRKFVYLSVCTCFKMILIEGVKKEFSCTSHFLLV